MQLIDSSKWPHASLGHSILSTESLRCSAILDLCTEKDQSPHSPGGNTGNHMDSRPDWTTGLLCDLGLGLLPHLCDGVNYMPQIFLSVRRPDKDYNYEVICKCEMLCKLMVILCHCQID